ncbi:triphosphoribosyl-dephospho-CoA synthase CitG [Weissella paramesenteroides]|nr:triphosphoribosyl-dephospho-CoA synthase CitG [Weissella paramesenteroides]KAA8439428.1 triphosphoribosyl-dephospho-CoA synthase CitG [Weissella paramesenteroides]
MYNQQVVNAALQALLYEVSVTPKPGLVDPASVGAHDDMDVFTFIDSAITLRPYFEAVYQQAINFDKRDLSELFEQIRPLGITAEQEMFAATNNVNTHKGAIFSLGILVAATGVLERQKIPYDTTKLMMVVEKMLTHLLKNDFADLSAKKKLTAGEKQFLQYGKGGIREEAAAGYPTVIKVALPYLRRNNGTRNQRLLNTLMLIVKSSQDSNLIKRAGSVNVLPWVKEKVDFFFSLGGSQTEGGRLYLEQLDNLFIEKNLSLGGSADLLILTIYCALLEGIL